MDHGLPIEQRVRDGPARIAKELSLPFVVTNDSHYSQPGDATGARGAAVRADATNLA
jgi:DNA polymerase-3 subunit alpha